MGTLKRGCFFQQASRRYLLSEWLLGAGAKLSLAAAALVPLTAYPAANREPLPTNVVVLTFDDSVKTQVTFVAPLLDQLDFSATFFITEGFGFKTNKDDYMTWADILQLASMGFEIGNHTRDHMGVTATSLGRLAEQIEAVNADCQRRVIPQPVSFAYPGNSFDVGALPILKAAGIKFARRGGSPEYAYEQGKGVAYEPAEDHPLLIPTAGDARPNWTLDDFKKALSLGGKAKVVVFQFHGVPDLQHPWVSTPPDRFREYMLYLKEHDYHVLALRDLERYVDPAFEPPDPLAKIKRRQQQIGDPDQQRIPGNNR
jgi:peptidoglycan/xylan/chitin deacetylase (PgdA/CDA1 family)